MSVLGSPSPTVPTVSVDVKLRSTLTSTYVRVSRGCLISVARFHRWPHGNWPAPQDPVNSHPVARNPIVVITNRHHHRLCCHHCRPRSSSSATSTQPVPPAFQHHRHHRQHLHNHIIISKSTQSVSPAFPPFSSFTRRGDGDSGKEEDTSVDPFLSFTTGDKGVWCGVVWWGGQAGGSTKCLTNRATGWLVHGKNPPTPRS